MLQRRDLILRKHFESPELEPDSTNSDRVYVFGRATQALLYSALFVPEFRTVDGSVLLCWNFWDQEQRDQFTESRASCAEDPKRLEELESNYNWIEVGYIFREADSTDDEDEALADLIANSWRGVLKSRYPARNFVVQVYPPEVTGGTVGVGFFEKRTPE